MPKKKDVATLEGIKAVEEPTLDETISGLKEFLGSIEEDGNIPYFLDTGHMALNYVISSKIVGGGYPGGQTSELFGEPSTGKTLLITRAGAQMQERGGIFVMMDSEQRWDKNFALINGVDMKAVIYYQPRTVEEFTTKTYDLLTKYYAGHPYLIALDSLADLELEAEVTALGKGEMPDDQGRRAKRMKAAVRDLRSLINSTQSVLLLANHVYSDPKSMSRKPVSSSGRGPQYRSSVRVEMDRPKLIYKSEEDEKKGKRPLGSRLHCTVVKNSIAPPFGKCDVDVFWRSGVDKYSGLLELMKELEIIEISGGWLSYTDVTGHTLPKFRTSEFTTFVQNNPGVFEDDKWEHPYFMGEQ